MKVGRHSIRKLPTRPIYLQYWLLSFWPIYNTYLISKNILIESYILLFICKIKVNRNKFTSYTVMINIIYSLDINFFSSQVLIECRDK